MKKSSTLSKDKKRANSPLYSTVRSPTPSYRRAPPPSRVINRSPQSSYRRVPPLSQRYSPSYKKKPSHSYKQKSSIRKIPKKKIGTGVAFLAVGVLVICSLSLIPNLINSNNNNDNNGGDPPLPPPSQGRESYDGPWGGTHVELRDVWEENWIEGLSSREKYLLVSNNDCSQSSVKDSAQTNGFSVLAQEGDNDSGATLLEVQGNSEKDGLKAILDVGKITITAVTTDGTLIHDGGGAQDGEDEERQAFGSTDNTNTGGGVYHLDINANEDGVTIWDRDHPCENFRGGFMYLRWG